MQSSWLFKIPITIALGIGIGLGLAQVMVRVNLSDSRESFFQGRWAATGQTNAETFLGIGVRGKSTVELGSIESGRRLERELMLENRGTGGAEFWLAGAPPAALRLDIPVDQKIKIDSRGTYPLSVIAVPNQLQPEFKKLLVLQTNQGDRKVVLSVSGTITGGLCVTPDKQMVPRAGWTPGAQFDCYVLSSQETPPEIKSISVRGTGNPTWVNFESVAMATDEVAKFRETQGELVRSGWHIKVLATEPLPETLKSFTVLINTQAANFEPLELPVTIDN